VLFRAARDISDAGIAPVDGCVEVDLTVRVSADADNGALELRYDSVTDGSIVVRLPMPF
jgi:hypothetical protein